MTVKGPWQFTLAPRLFDINRPTGTHLARGKAVSAGITVSVDRVENRPSGLAVYYTITSALSHEVKPVTPTVRLAFEDGSYSPSEPMQFVGSPVTNTNSSSGMAIITSAHPVSFVSVFPPLAKAAENAQLEVGDFLTTTGSSASIVIHQPFGKWYAAPETIDGETMAVQDVNYDGDALRITVENMEPISRADIMFLGVGVDSITATDGQGNNYRAVWSTTGTRQQRDELGAGSSIIGFEGINSNVDQLSVTVPHSSKLIRGDWAVGIPLS
jgi:hypothetical protein